MSSSIAPTPSGAARNTIAGPELSAADRAALLALARGAIDAALAGRPPPGGPEGPRAALRRGAFVTLADLKPRALRGCIGHVMSDGPLGEVIRDVAVSAARSDPRFPPVQRVELSALRIEISVRDEPVRLTTNQLCQGMLVVGRDGV